MNMNDKIQILGQPFVVAIAKQGQHPCAGCSLTTNDFVPEQFCKSGKKMGCAFAKYGMPGGKDGIIFKADPQDYPDFFTVNVAARTIRQKKLFEMK
jgi:hypothetical protein